MQSSLEPCPATEARPRWLSSLQKCHRGICGSLREAHQEELAEAWARQHCSRVRPGSLAPLTSLMLVPAREHDQDIFASRTDVCTAMLAGQARTHMRACMAVCQVCVPTVAVCGAQAMPWACCTWWRCLGA